MPRLRSEQIPMFLSVILLLIILVFFGIFYGIIEKRVEDAYKTQEAIEFITLLSDIEYNFAVERGLSAGVLVALDGSEQLRLLKKQRPQTDQAEKALRDFTAHYISEKFLADVKLDLLYMFEKKADIREQIDKLNIEEDVFDYFSRINRLSLESSVVITSRIASSELAQKSLAIIALSALKEAAGQSRGLLNQVFNSGEADKFTYAKIKSSLDAEDYATRQAVLLIEREDLSAFNELTSGTVWQDVERIKDRFFEQREQSIYLSDFDPVEWFELATKRIALLEETQQALLDELNQAVQEEIKLSNTLRYFLLVVLVLMVIPIALFKITLKFKGGDTTSP